MASFLTINDDCLCRIISFLDDPVSFHSVAVSCKRVQQVINNTRSILHPKLLRVKAEYYIKCFLVEITDGRRDSNKFRNLENLLCNAAHFTAAKELLTYAKVVKVWEINGPVAAKLFTWIRNQESRTEEGVRRATYFNEYRSVTLHLPGCDKDLKIDTTYFHTHVINNNNKLSIHATCGDLDVTSEGVTRYCPCDFDCWEEEECHVAVEPMTPVLELMQKELDETVPQMTNKFFVWLCYFFPHQNTLETEHILSFKDQSRKVKPNLEDVQPAIDLFHQNLQADTRLRNLVSGWNNPDSNLPSLITKTMTVLIQRSESTEFLEKLRRDANSFYEIASDLRQRPLPKPLVQDLLLRTELESSDYKTGFIADRLVESRASFRFSGGKVVKAWGGMHGKGVSYPTWYRLELKVTLPNREELQLDTDHRYRRIPIQVERLSPVTELFRQGVNEGMEGEEHISMLDDHLTAYYLLHALKFGGEGETFLRGDDENVSRSQSSEERSYEGSEEEHSEEEHSEEEHNEEEHSEEEHSEEEHSEEEHSEEEHSEEEHSEEEHSEEEHSDEQ